LCAEKKSGRFARFRRGDKGERFIRHTRTNEPHGVSGAAFGWRGIEGQTQLLA
jgi:hypothetical protein